ncbi:MAG: von Willebrand factor type A domain-containing protein [Candidatus Omnitrophota bacterium]|jgi:Ca-activated chloride channel family protein
MIKCSWFIEISRFVDNELEGAQKEALEKHLGTCVLCREELARLHALSEKLKSWHVPDLDAGFQNAVIKEAVRRDIERGAVKMKKKTLAILVPSSVVVTLLIVMLFGQMYIKRGVQGRLRQAADDIGDQYRFSTSQYEPYYTRESQSVNERKSVLADSKGLWEVSPAEEYRFPTIPSQFNTEDYNRIYENDFLKTIDNPLSTFSIDVDTASYANLRRFLTANSMPVKDAVRIEEMINYFTYDYPQPEAGKPFSVTTEVAPCPWNTAHKLVLVGLQGKTMVTEDLPQSNLVFLIDVSGSMDEPNKLPLLQSAFKLLVKQLRSEDTVSIVVYAGSSGVILDSVNGACKSEITHAIESLNAGGSTAGAAGITRAYAIAKKNFIRGGNNRVILATDGDFNVGVSSDSELVRLIEEKRNDGIFLTVLGFGAGNYQDAKMEQLADKGNGNFSYIDNMMEAKKVFVSQLTGTLFTIAKDVKIQVEFNQAKVKAYRLIGYENRMLKKEDFNDDKKDAGELGAGHSVTALYEIVAADSSEEFGTVDPLKYQQVVVSPSEELLTVKLRYKEPDEDTSKLLTKVLMDNEKLYEKSGNINFSSAVAEFGLLLRDSQYKGTAAYENVLNRARKHKGNDSYGYRGEFIRLVEIAQILDNKNK